MKAIPVWQQWASLIAIGAKRVETRHYPAPPELVGQRIAIHATLTRDHLAFADSGPFRRRLEEARDEGRLALVDGQLPLGAIVATVVVDRCRRMTRESIAELTQRDPDERAFGYYGPDRFAWVLRDLEALTTPAPARGDRGIYFEIPDELVTGQLTIGGAT